MKATRRPDRMPRQDPAEEPIRGHHGKPGHDFERQFSDITAPDVSAPISSPARTGRLHPA
jgi:hypothetical protein